MVVVGNRRNRRRRLEHASVIEVSVSSNNLVRQFNPELPFHVSNTHGSEGTEAAEELYE